MSERRSRVKKFADLREEIMSVSSDKIETSELSPYANQLHKLDQQQFENMDIQKNEHKPLHLRRHGFDISSVDSINDQIDPIDNEKLDNLFESASEELIEDTDSFKSHYLSDFISEAKQYNVEKGFRVEHDTKSNLLKELKAQEDFEDFDFELESFDDEVIETLDHPTEVAPDPRPNLRPEDLFEPKDFVQEDYEETIEFHSDEVNAQLEQEDNFEETIMMQVARLAQEEMSNTDYMDYEPNDLLEATTQLKIQLDHQNEVVKDMETRIDKTSRSMNILLTALIICLVLLIAAFGYVLLRLYGMI